MCCNARPLERSFQNTSPKTSTPAKTAGGDAKETEAFGEYFGTMNKKRVHKGETEALGNRSKIFREKKELLQRSVLKKPFTKTFT